jgi:hypothetical protein
VVQFTIDAFLWLQDPKAGVKGSDKIWGIVQVDDRTYTFWGRRSDEVGTKKHLTFRLASRDDDLWTAQHGKERKGYKRISKTMVGDQYPDIEAVYPNFVKSFKNQLFLAKLSDNIKNTGRFVEEA